jgi:hypothetical protein
MKYILAVGLICFGFTDHIFTKIDETLQGTFFPYHSAMGSGKGIIFRVKIPSTIAKTHSIDSFYIHNKSYPFKLMKSKNKFWIETNYYLPLNETLNSSSQIKQIVDTVINSKDSIIENHNFYPSWIIATGKNGKQKIEIQLYNQIMSENKY